MDSLATRTSMETVFPCKAGSEHSNEWVAFLRHCGGFEVWYRRIALGIDDTAMTQIRGDRLYVNVSASEARRRLQGHG